MRQLATAMLLVAALCAGTACEKVGGGTAGGSSGAGAGATDPTGGHAGAPGSAPVRVARAAAERETGYVAVAMAGENVEVAARVAGELEAVLVRMGDRVEAGQVLARVDATAIREELEIARARLAGARAELARAGVAAEEADDRFKRRETVPEILPAEELRGARYAARMADATARRAGAELAEQKALIARLERQLREVEIVAPFAGVVAARYVDAGAVLTVGMRVVRLIGGAQNWLKFAVPGSEAKRLALGQRIEVELAGQTLRGRIRQIAPELDPATQMIFAEAEIEGEANVQPGQAGRVWLEKPTRSPTPRLP